jgi:small subunit ribosomal protein S5
MNEETQQEATTPEVATPTVAAEGAQIAPTDAPAATTPSFRGRAGGDRRNNNRRDGAGGGDRRNPRRPRRGGARNERARSEFEQKIISIRRVTRVTGGGRRFSFSVAMVIGDKKGKVGVGLGKAGDTQLAIEKANRDAKKNMLVVPMNKDQHIPHDVHTKYASSEVMIMPAPGRGLVAGSSVRTVLELAGVKDVTAKLFSRSKNKLNNAKAAIEALRQLKA